MKYLWLLLFLCGVSAAVAAPSRAASAFDYYTLSLSWSPAFCTPNNAQKPENATQCQSQKAFGFVVHGLWPQYNNGTWPETCISNASAVPKETIDTMMPLMPSVKLINHEWKKHGTCATDNPSHYFELVQKAYKNVVIPDTFVVSNRPTRRTPAQMREEFIKSNPKLNADALQFICKRRRPVLNEVRVCMSKDLSVIACPSSAPKTACEEFVSVRIDGRYKQ